MGKAFFVFYHGFIIYGQAMAKKFVPALSDFQFYRIYGVR